MSDKVEMDLGEVERKVVALWAKRDAETAKYLAAYDAACSLAIFIEHIEAGWQPKSGEALMEDAKAKLRKLAGCDGNDFFTRFERIER